MSSIVVKILTISPYFWTTESPYFGFTRLAALDIQYNRLDSMWGSGINHGVCGKKGRLNGNQVLLVCVR